MKSRAWKWLLGIAAGVAAALGGLLWSLHSRATAVFERHEAEVKIAIAELRARPAEVVRLFDPERPGNGWDALVKALAAAASIPDSDGDEIPAINGMPDFKPDPVKVEAVFLKHAAVVDALREAARYREFRPEYRYEAGSGVDLIDLNAAFRAMRFLSGRATHAHEQGRGKESLESILLGLALAQSVGRDGPTVSFLVQVICEAIIVDALRQILPKHGFQATELESFAGKLDLLHRARRQAAETVAVEEVIVRQTLVDWGLRGTVDGSLGEFRIDRSWRYLFSRRLAYAGALGEFEAYFPEIRRALALPSSRRLEALAELRGRMEASRNPSVSRNSGAFHSMGRRDLEAHLEWTLLRVSTALAWHEVERNGLPGRLEDLVPRYLPEVPSCPVTSTPLRYKDGRLWSVGRNGVDDGGTPGLNGDVMDDTGDVIWTVKRK